MQARQRLCMGETRTQLPGTDKRRAPALLTWLSVLHSWGGGLDSSVEGMPANPNSLSSLIARAQASCAWHACRWCAQSASAHALARVSSICARGMHGGQGGLGVPVVRSGGQRARQQWRTPTAKRLDSRAAPVHATSQPSDRHHSKEARWHGAAATPQGASQRGTGDACGKALPWVFTTACSARSAHTCRMGLGASSSLAEHFWHMQSRACGLRKQMCSLPHVRAHKHRTTTLTRAQGAGCPMHESNWQKLRMGAQGWLGEPSAHRQLAELDSGCTGLAGCAY